jgi:hypothetical protein
MNDHVHRFAHQRVQRRQRQLVRDLRELTDESQPSQGLTRGARVDGRESLDAGREGQQQWQRLAVPDFTHDGDVGCHAQEAGDQPPQVDRRPVESRRTSLHRRDVRQRHVGLEYLFRDHHT